MMLKLEAKTNNEKIILDYLNQNASESLAEKINHGEKNLSQCWSYIVSEAKKLAENNCACVDDATVFGWAIHFFEEDSIEAKNYNKSSVKSTVKAVKTSTKPSEKPTEKTSSSKNKVNPGQLSFDDMFNLG